MASDHNPKGGREGFTLKGSKNKKKENEGSDSHQTSGEKQKA